MKLSKLFLFLLFVANTTLGQPFFEKDTIDTNNGPLVITFIGHASLIIEWKDEVIYIDPSSREANYYKLPKATKIFVTHHHGDHCDKGALKAITQDKTKTFMSSYAHEKWNQGMVLRPGKNLNVDGVGIETIAAYNIEHKREDGTPYHEYGECNAYVITLGDTRILIGGDTENTPELKAVRDIDIAFLPMNLPYTMTPEMVADAARAIKPRILYPYHFDKSDVNHLKELLKDEKEIDVRIRRMD